MRIFVLSAAALVILSAGGLTGKAAAGQRYDRKIEQAAIAIVTAKLGDIRGAHEIDEPHSLYPPVGARSVADGTLQPAPFERRAPAASGFSAILTVIE